MFIKFTVVGSVLCVFSLVRAFGVTPYIEDEIPQHLNITTDPFLKIGHGFYYIEVKTSKNWFDAFASCRRLGANLIAFENIEEWDLINQYLWKNKLNNGYWTSGTDLANNGQHEWFSTGQPISLNIWYPGEPNNMDGVEHCDVLGDRATQENYNTFNDFNCERNLFYICEAPPAKTAPFVIKKIYQFFKK